MHMVLLHAKDGVRSAEEHDPAVLALHFDIAELLAYDLFRVSVDHLVSGHADTPVFRAFVWCELVIERPAPGIAAPAAGRRFPRDRWEVRCRRSRPGLRLHRRSRARADR